MDAMTPNPAGFPGEIVSAAVATPSFSAGSNASAWNCGFGIRNSNPCGGAGGAGNESLHSGARMQQLSQRVVHLEADLALLRQRKVQLEHENESLAAAAQRPDLEAKLSDALATTERLEAECRRHRAESARRAELEQQQIKIARTFSELQGVVSQLVRRLGELDAERVRLTEERSTQEAIAAALRVEFQNMRPLRASSIAGRDGHGHGSAGRDAGIVYGRSHSLTSSGSRRRSYHARRIVCRADMAQP